MTPALALAGGGPTKLGPVGRPRLSPGALAPAAGLRLNLCMQIALELIPALVLLVTAAAETTRPARSDRLRRRLARNARSGAARR